MRRILLFVTLLTFTCSSLWAQDKKAVTGTVKDEKGTLLPGVTVLEKGTSNGAATMADGTFKINAAPTATLVISFMGYVAQEVAVNGQASLNVILKEDSKNLNEVVVTALGM
ncbi:carboxypeptidase-like regulatory domain-containing protein [Chitinophaga horti]|uniref:Carboxypeptidase-like regulatory domain-containing protein n=1 Tax=Chitinophaga horti TaxID=2920382 RepID=A0ABY6J2M1_9BACT|nr:carboxypeptidase-like regulatory domain-containing protein [Chitinophaga horti]UYQ93905.1 carboxypeptidase-like regulatory domain-containing protein [Chitinophaga horti]